MRFSDQAQEREEKHEQLPVVKLKITIAGENADVQEQEGAEEDDTQDDDYDETELDSDWSVLAARECKTNKIYPILRNDAGKLILMKRVANRRNTAYHPTWWNTGQGANRTKESIVRPGQNYRLWICHPDDWTIVHTFGSVLDKNWKMDARTDTKMFQFLKPK